MDGLERKRGKLAQSTSFSVGERKTRSRGHRRHEQAQRRSVRPSRSIRYSAAARCRTAPGRQHRASAQPRAVRSKGRSHHSGYGIIQPRVGVSLTSAHKSYFAVIHSGHPGSILTHRRIGRVPGFVRRGHFTGRASTMSMPSRKRRTVASRRDPLLSHDLTRNVDARWPGNRHRSVHDYPARYLTFTRRKHRWIRGDWQLLGWLKGTVPRS